MNLKSLKAFTLIVVLQLFFGCRNQHPNKELDKFLDNEINNRLEMLRQDSLETPGNTFDFTAFNRQVQSFLLMTKDVENLKANAQLTNSFFAEKTEQLNLTDVHYTPINTGMTLDNIATQIKQNELSILNACVLKAGRHTLPMNTVH